MKVGSPGTATTLSVPGYTVGDTSITVGSTSNWSTDTGVVFAIDQAQVVNGVEVQVAGTYNEYVGTVASGTSVSNVSWAAGSGNRNYAAGALTRVYIPVSATRENRIVDWGLAHANQDGTLKTTAVQAALNISAAVPSDYTTLAQTATTITPNGNRSYTLTFPGVNYTDRLSPGMRLRTVRSAAAPNQSASLNGTTQYFSKTSPAGMTFTNNFVVGAWVKLNSYAATNMDIVSRYNGTSGWILRVSSTGQVQLVALNAGAANYMEFKSYQSLPLNKWVHVSAQMDMTVTTNTATTNYITLDGVDVPLVATRNGTSPTALVQAGNLEIGSANGGTEFFPGKIAQVAIFNAKVTQATMRGYISQGLSGTEPSLISAYSFNNSITDLNTTNANNLTANGGAVATNADSPFGGQADGSISATVDYGIIQRTTYNAPDTTVVVQVPEGCTIPTSGGVSSVSYSTMRSPYGFPAESGKHTLDFLWTAQSNTGIIASTSTIAPITGVSVSVPLGAYDTDMTGFVAASSGGVTFNGAYVGLSNLSNAFSFPKLTSLVVPIGTSQTDTSAQVYVRDSLSISSATTLYVVGNPVNNNTNIYIGRNVAKAPTVISMKNAYL